MADARVVPVDLQGIAPEVQVAAVDYPLVLAGEVWA